MSADKEKLLGMFPLFRSKAPILDTLRGLAGQQKAGVKPEELNEAQRKLAEEFKRGIADALGVPPEAIRQEPVENWVVQWTKAWVKPEYYAQTVVAMSASTAYNMGHSLGEMMATFIAEAPK